MYVEYSENEEVLSTTDLKHYKCPNCLKHNSTQVSVIAQYTKVYHSSMGVNRKLGKSVCKSCGFIQKCDDLPFEAQQEISELIKRAKTPLKHYGWFFAIGAAIIAYGLLFYFYSFDSKRFLNSPEVGDKYEIRIKEADDNPLIKKTTYSWMKVIVVSKDSVTFLLNNKGTDSSLGLEKIDISDNYTDWKKTVSKEELKKMYNRDEIGMVHRKTWYSWLFPRS